MKNIVLGVLAHVDAGKTTLTEAILYQTGEVKNLGRVDRGNTFLDHNEMERERGITIFSKQACFQMGDSFFSLLDTPGHVDFSAEMERTLQVLDYGVLVVNGADGIQGHTLTLWRLLSHYHVPVILFINKMDQERRDKEELLGELREEFGDGCVAYDGNVDGGDFYEQAAMCDEAALEQYLDMGKLTDDELIRLIQERKLFLCCFGSALHMQGVDTLLKAIENYTVMPKYGDSFGARVYKITRDSQGNRLTHMKLTGGSVEIKTQINGEKINQIRIYSGEKYQTENLLESGRVCAVTGLENTYAGQGLGICKEENTSMLEPVVSYKVTLPDTISSRQAYPLFRQMEEELPELHVDWNEEAEEITVRLMGQVQLEILKKLLWDRHRMDVSFGQGSITYRETIANTVIGVGHFEPLRHYAEVHLLLEPGERDSGIVVETDCSEDILDKNWQRLIRTHLKERSFAGVLTGAPITDLKITVINGRSHQKHTEGGDFRQATYRAVRQGLMQAESVLLEPFYRFRLEIPSDMLGKAMTDIESMYGTMDPPEIHGDKARITGCAPVSTMWEYQKNVNSYTRGCGSLFCTFDGYRECHNQKEIVAARTYDPESDLANPSASVFCAHGSGFLVPWDQVYEYMHVKDEMYDEDTDDTKMDLVRQQKDFDYSIGYEEVDEILARTYDSNRKSGKQEFKKKKPPMPTYRKTQSKSIPKEKMLLVDGYNVVYAWEELKELIKVNLDSAKDRLIQILSDYQAISGEKIVLVFDGYKVKGNMGSEEQKDHVLIVHTREGETADQFIERFTNSKGEDFLITVASSDGLIQQITRGQNCLVVSSRELLERIETAKKQLREDYHLE